MGYQEKSSSPFAVLARKLTAAGPPSLSILIAKMSDAEEFGEFVDLVRLFLPENESEILHNLEPTQQMCCFASHFSDKYFPLDANLLDMVDEDYGYSDFIRWVPIIPMGISYEVYESLSGSDDREGFKLLVYLFTNPYDDSRVSIGEACVESVSRELLARVPEEGYETKYLHQLLDGTIFEAVAKFGDWLGQDTGNYFLDTTEEYLWNGATAHWSMENVKALTIEWQQAERHRKGTDEIIEWLEEDPVKNYEELLDFIEERREKGGVNGC